LESNDAKEELDRKATSNNGAQVYEQFLRSRGRFLRIAKEKAMNVMDDISVVNS